MAARARIQRTVVSGVGVAMIPSGANAPSWATVSVASRCAAADSQPGPAYGARLLRTTMAPLAQDVRVLARRQSDTQPQVTFFAGDLRQGEGIDPAVRGAGMIIHCATSTKGDADPADVTRLSPARTRAPRPQHPTGYARRYCRAARSPAGQRHHARVPGTKHPALVTGRAASNSSLTCCSCIAWRSCWYSSMGTTTATT